MAYTNDEMHNRVRALTTDLRAALESGESVDGQRREDIKAVMAAILDAREALHRATRPNEIKAQMDGIFGLLCACYIAGQVDERRAWKRGPGH